jgi:hypothetical protein
VANALVWLIGYRQTAGIGGVQYIFSLPFNKRAVHYLPCKLYHFLALYTRSQGSGLIHRCNRCPRNLLSRMRRSEKETEDTVLLVLPDRMFALQHDYNHKPGFTIAAITLKYTNFSSLDSVQ